MLVFFLFTCPVKEVSNYTCTCHSHLSASFRCLHEFIHEIQEKKML